MGSKGGLEYKKGFFDNEAAWLMLDVASSRLGVSVVDTANAISCRAISPIRKGSIRAASRPPR